MHPVVRPIGRAGRDGAPRHALGREDDLELIDEGETDHKSIVLREDDPHFSSINSVQDLDRVRPGTIKMLVDWMKMYKTSDGKGINTLESDTPTTAAEAKLLIQETHEMYAGLKKGDSLAANKYWMGA